MNAPYTFVSIPRSGFCSFKHSPAARGGAIDHVSIPRSGFCSFKPKARTAVFIPSSCFNPSVGILFIQAILLDSREWRKNKFQSLGRDSVHSSWTPATAVHFDGQFQSLGRDSVHSSSVNWLAIMGSGRRFNPSVGILFIQAHLSVSDGCSGWFVSIPRSGFCSFKPNYANPIIVAIKGFNPSVGILFIQAGGCASHCRAFRSFNPSVGILFIQASSSALTIG